MIRKPFPTTDSTGSIRVVGISSLTGKPAIEMHAKSCTPDELREMAHYLNQLAEWADDIYSGP